MEVQQWYKELTTRLEPVLGTREAATTARIIITHLLPQVSWGGVSFSRIRVEEAALTVGQEAATRVVAGEPVQYVLGEAWFDDLLLTVSPAVLIPRPETEELVLLASQRISSHATVVDIGTGSGCIALALKRRHPDARLIGVDVSEVALNLAAVNSQRLKLPVEWVQMDVRNMDAWQQLPVMDILISNPPYIPVSEANSMDTRVTRFEPHVALFVPDDSPLIFYELLSKLGMSHLRETGWLLAEIHEDLASEVQQLWEIDGWKVTVHLDLQGKPRMVAAQKIGNS